MNARARSSLLFSHSTIRLLMSALIGLSCRTSNPRASSTLPDYGQLRDEQIERLALLEAQAVHNPQDFQAQKRAGLALMWQTLAGQLSLQSKAEMYLQRAFELRQTDEELSRSLGRFYNLRALNYDFSRATEQERVYDALLGDLEVAQMRVDQFVAHSFRMLARIVYQADAGRQVAALKLVRQLEAELAMKSAAAPNDVELHALAGNFAVFFAGFVPFAKKARLRVTVQHFEYVHDHWPDIRAGIRNSAHCPNTRENFMFELAESHLALGQLTRARELFSELQAVQPGATRAQALIAEVSRHRLQYLSDYAGDRRLMPPWPSDAGNCVVCHATTATVPMESLHLLHPLDATAQ